MKLRLAHILAISLLVVLQGCFTGIESTPKITGDDVKKMSAAPSVGDTYLDDVRQQPLGEWQRGKQFVVTDGKIGLLLGGRSASARNLMGDTLSFASVRDVTTPTGDDVAEFELLAPDGEVLTYRSDYSVAKLQKKGSVEIPFAVDLDIVDQVGKKMKGRDYYTLTSMWFDGNNQSLSGRKFVKVTIDDVVAGNSYYPVRLVARDERGGRFYLWMSVGSDTKSPRKFGNLLSVTDPHLNYPQISSGNWERIKRGDVAEDMTREECRLSLGAPASVDRRPGYSVLREVWSYENGIYLIFEDGLLKSFRR